MSSELKLKPCPFCGGVARRSCKSGRVGVASPSRWLRETVECKSCGVSVTKNRPYAAIEAWNTRAPTVAPPASREKAIEEVRPLIEAVRGLEDVLSRAALAKQEGGENG